MLRDGRPKRFTNIRTVVIRFVIGGVSVIIIHSSKLQPGRSRGDRTGFRASFKDEWDLISQQIGRRAYFHAQKEGLVSLSG